MVSGHGNNSGDGTEGVILGSAVGTYLRGPCLPKNPALADFLIGAAVIRRHGVADLPPLADDLEEGARAAAMRRALEAAARTARAKRRLSAFAQAGLMHGRHARTGAVRAALHVSARRRPAGSENRPSSAKARSGGSR